MADAALLACRTSENALRAKFAELPFQALGWILTVALGQVKELLSVSFFEKAQPRVFCELVAYTSFAP